MVRVASFAAFNLTRLQPYVRLLRTERLLIAAAWRVTDCHVHCLAASEVLDLELEPVFGEAECVKQTAKGSRM